MVERPWKAGVESAIDALTRHQARLREDIDKTTQASILENLAVSRMNDLVGLQAVQIRDLVRQVGDLEGRLNRHLEGMGYSE
jgi:hypothetical protein